MCACVILTHISFNFLYAVDNSANLISMSKLGLAWLGWAGLGLAWLGLALNVYSEYKLVEM